MQTISKPAKKKARRKRMLITVGVILIITGLVLIFFNIPYSPVKSQFRNDVNSFSFKGENLYKDEVFTEKDFEKFPKAIQEYIKSNGYIGKKKMTYLKMEYKNVDFSRGKEGQKMMIDYTQYDFVKEPSRIALIESSMFGVPFEGYDYYKNGIGGMKGTVGKAITIFDQKGKEMDTACLVTYLSESLFAPSILLNNNVTFNEIDDKTVKATITYNNTEATGVFHFNDNYEMTSFTTDERGYTDGNGKAVNVPWSAVCENYNLSPSGIKYPTKFKAVWNFKDGDFTYFDGTIDKIYYNYLL